MSSLSDYVLLTITRDSVGVARAGFGVMMILSANATFPERVRYYNGLADVGVDFATTSPEYLAAQAAFSQSPHPPKIAIGRAALQPTQVYVISVSSVINSHAYKVNVAGQGVTTTTVTATSDSSATNDEIVALLVTALNGVTGKNYTATATGTVGSQVVTVTGNAAGNWFSLEVQAVTELGIQQTHADPGVATDLAAIRLADDGWYALLTLYNSKAYVQAAAAWVEANSKIYIPDVNDTQALTTTVGNNDVLDALHTSGYARTMGAYHSSPVSMLAAAWYGRVLPIDPGGETWKFKTLKGVPFNTFTATQRNNLVARKGNGYESVAGLSITFEGSTSDGDFLDNQRGLDWLIDDLTKSVFEALAGNEKIPFEDDGVSIIEGKVRASLKRAVQRRILAKSPEPVITVPAVADVSTSDKAARTLPDVKFTATRSGAIHKAIIQGVVSL